MAYAYYTLGTKLHKSRSCAGGQKHGATEYETEAEAEADAAKYGWGHCGKCWGK